MARIQLLLQRNKGGGSHPAELLLSLAGVWGVLLLLWSHESVDFSLWAVLPATAVLCLVLWFGRARGRSCFAGVFFGSTALLALAAFWLREELLEEIFALWEGFTGEAAPRPVTLLGLMAGLLLCLLFFGVEYGLKGHGVLHLLTLALLLAAPMAGIRPHPGIVLLLLLFQVALWAVEAGEFSGSPTPASQRRLAGRSGMVVVGFLALAFAAALLLSSLYAGPVYDAVYGAEGFVVRTVKRATGSSSGGPAGEGEVSRGNLYRTGEGRLELELSREPKETLYLRGFQGGDYANGVWKPADDEALYLASADRMGWTLWGERMEGMYESMYFVLNESMQRDEPPEPYTLTVRDAGAGGEYAPYFSRLNPGEERDGIALYQYYELADMDVTWENIRQDFTRQGEWYRTMEQNYRYAMQSVYTHVPTSLYPRLAALAEKYPTAGVEEATQWIRGILADKVYTLTPGLSPWSEDVVEHFLFTGKGGYCVHFASAAVLLYRVRGIPARYASGYAVAPSQFEREGEVYRARVTDESAHAWVEIYREDLGWVPVEMTPAAEISSPYAPSLPLELPEREEQEFHMPSSPKKDRGELSLPALVFSGGRGAWIWALLLALGSAAGVGLFLRRERRRLEAVEEMDCRELFSLLLLALRFAGLEGCDGREEDFVSRWRTAVPEVTEGEAAQVLELVTAAAYGPGSPKEGAGMVREVYRRTARCVYGKLGPWKKLGFRWRLGRQSQKMKGKFAQSDK